jgi:hypothetical protein
MVSDDADKESASQKTDLEGPDRLELPMFGPFLVISRADGGLDSVLLVEIFRVISGLGRHI